jgi:hypothetical protein
VNLVDVRPHSTGVAFSRPGPVHNRGNATGAVSLADDAGGIGAVSEVRKKEL